jgi:glycine cleavage system aminomethyltransferase T
VLASRISYVGELGWELHVPIEQGAKLWSMLHEAGSAYGAVPVGIGVYGTTGRIEKGYRAFGFELDSERTIIEAGMARPKVKAADFVGRDAYLKQRVEDPKAVLCTLTVEDHTSKSGQKRYMLGGEPILSKSGGELLDDHGHRPYVTTAGSAPSLGKHVLMAYLPPQEARVGNELTVSYMEELYPVTVGSADATSLFDPSNERIKA